MALFHQDVDYGRPLVSFCSTLIKKHAIPTNSAIVLGCGGGYTSFRLSGIFNSVRTATSNIPQSCFNTMILSQVVGVDFSGRLMDAACQFQEKGEVVWKDGEEEWSLRLPDDIKFTNVIFKQVILRIYFCWSDSE